MKSLQELYDKKEGENYYEKMGRAIIENLDIHGFGVMPKADIEALLFHCICNTIEDVYKAENKHDYNLKNFDYDLMQMLRISPAKLRSLRVTRSAKFLNDLDYNSDDNKKRLINVLKNVTFANDDIQNGKIKISISDPHNQNLIERIVEDNNSVLDRSFNSKLLVLNADQLLTIVEIIFGEDVNNTIYDQINEKLGKDYFNIKKRNSKIDKSAITNMLLESGINGGLRFLYDIIKQCFLNR